MEFPPIQDPRKTPSKETSEKFRDAYQNVSAAKDLIKMRLDKLKYEGGMLRGLRSDCHPYNKDIASLYNLKNLSNVKGQLANPNLYSYQFMDPIYYPLEMPVNAEPITLPKIELGAPVGAPAKPSGFNIQDLLALLAALYKPPPAQSQPTYYEKPNTPLYLPQAPQEKRKIKLPEKEIIPTRDWWKLARDFVNLYKFFSTANKYGKFSHVRNNMITQQSKAIVQHLQALKNWMISIEEPFWNEFKVFPNLNVAFKNIDSKLKIRAESQKIIAMIKKFMEGLIGRCSKLSDVPERVQTIIYEYIKERAYYPKKYLSTFQVNRIDSNFYGGSKGLSEGQMGMLVAFLIISRVAVQQILLHMKDNFEVFKNYPNIEITAKYIGSILHYLTRDTFRSDPPMLKELLALLNYYRNYHIYNEQVEKQQDIFNNNMVFLDSDEYAESLVPESQITEFWSLNAPFVQTYKKYIYPWACNLAKMIKLKYQKSDKNLEKKSGLKKPENKTVNPLEG